MFFFCKYKDIFGKPNTGLHKHLSTSTYITRGTSAKPFYQYIKNISKIDKGEKSTGRVKIKYGKAD